MGRQAHRDVTADAAPTSGDQGHLSCKRRRHGHSIAPSQPRDRLISAGCPARPDAAAP
jgi:hypothetical protein